ncbi:endonuclease/exonuclease/phosphatase family protein [Paeniglutamicibacter sp. Y32M11]|uniref:endonuclease/exonuclease/phosphatase family protein n=1 Tax=Paeniglutamicibacter sp. Y32M11 TaxID=2853258 RepID=UPI001C5336F4|nr:endonuclease/exonuclease/phosphatase family protein [Paeniglutamicibacter sp. Y32M11]QXQ10499.1 endonuclease/exonuclease/phosphatase family protein [Paeniglutamicibacter sp. Y32M11]
MRYSILTALLAVSLTAAAVGGAVPAQAQTLSVVNPAIVQPPRVSTLPFTDSRELMAPSSLRVATFNASLNRPNAGQLALDLSTSLDAQAKAVAEIIQRNAPDVLLLNEFDYDATGAAAQNFNTNYLNRSQRGANPIDYPYTYAAPSNTGIPSGADLDADGVIGGPGDALGFGDFEGQYAMVLYSKYPIDTDHIRTFQNFLWKDMPDSSLPTDYYGELIQSVLPLPSKSMWDVPISVDGKLIHVIAAHPTPPVFDGSEKRNQRRNHDEIRLLNDYLGADGAGEYIYDDAGARGPLATGSTFVVLGDLNSDATSGGSNPAAITALQENPLLVDPLPASQAQELSPELRRLAAAHNPLGTADFGPSTGVLRVDYVLPSVGLPVRDAGVYWPAAGQVGADLVSTWPPVSSDHRLVWVDIKLES